MVTARAVAAAHPSTPRGAKVMMSSLPSSISASGTRSIPPGSLPQLQASTIRQRLVKGSRSSTVVSTLNPRWPIAPRAPST
jgi:hypothetical protein